MQQAQVADHGGLYVAEGGTEQDQGYDRALPGQGGHPNTMLRERDRATQVGAGNGRGMAVHDVRLSMGTAFTMTTAPSTSLPQCPTARLDRYTERALPRLLRPALAR